MEKDVNNLSFTYKAKQGDDKVRSFTFNFSLKIPEDWTPSFTWTWQGSKPDALTNASLAYEVFLWIEVDGGSSTPPAEPGLLRSPSRRKRFPPNGAFSFLIFFPFQLLRSSILKLVGRLEAPKVLLSHLVERRGRSAVEKRTALWLNWMFMSLLSWSPWNQGSLVIYPFTRMCALHISGRRVMPYCTSSTRSSLLVLGRQNQQSIE